MVLLSFPSFPYEDRSIRRKPASPTSTSCTSGLSASALVSAVGFACDRTFYCLNFVFTNTFVFFVFIALPIQSLFPYLYFMVCEDFVTIQRFISIIRMRIIV